MTPRAQGIRVSLILTGLVWDFVIVHGGCMLIVVHEIA